MILALLACAHATSPASLSPAPPSATSPTPVASPLERPRVTPEETYRAWLGTQGVAGVQVREGAPALAEWHFYTVDVPGGWPSQPAAVSTAGLVAAREAPGGWQALLQAGPAETVGARVGWLLGNPVVLSAADPVEPGATIAAPALTTPSPGAVQLTMWVAWPPQVSAPYRVQLTAMPDGTATIDERHWSELK